ncbi:MAG: hypothetical protein QOJ65_1716 [Fimbriimonadaceae bacterium]|jgi:hypothetical protein|nr:hypothetical protein [Fimbriimonadaceae bacterium]
MSKFFSAFALAVLVTATVSAQDSVTKEQAAKPAPEAAVITARTFSDYQLNLAFDYPPSWQLIENPKAPKKKGLINLDVFKKKKDNSLNGPKKTNKETLFYIPVDQKTATLEIFSALYDQEPDHWETIMSVSNKQLKREVLKQWREEILGVPLLLTKVGFEDSGGQKMLALTGLMYSRMPNKLQFRLEAPASSYDNAEYEFRQALQSLRTLRGDMPKPEDPNHPLPESEYILQKPVKPPKEVYLQSGKQKTGSKIAKGTVSVPLTVSSRKVLLTMPEGWTSEIAMDGTVTLHNPAVKGVLVAYVFTTLDSDPPQSAVLKASGMSLEEFTKVDARRETVKESTAAGANLDAIWRVGSGDKGPLSTCDAVGATGDLYWVFRYRLQGTVSEGEQKAVQSLLESMSADPAP